MCVCKYKHMETFDHLNKILLTLLAMSSGGTTHTNHKIHKQNSTIVNTHPCIHIYKDVVCVQISVCVCVSNILTS